jgi:nucleotide-binding universal stress UspA family protein
MSYTILVGVDGSESSARAAEVALRRAKLIGARLVLVCVIEWSPYTIYTHEELEARHAERKAEIERAQTRVLEPLLTRLKCEGVEVESLVRHGHASRVLVDVTHELGAGEIVVGRVGRSMFIERLFGSTTSNLVQAAPVPVTVVP